jgi:hypothetical protein
MGTDFPSYAYGRHQSKAPRKKYDVATLLKSKAAFDALMKSMGSSDDWEIEIWTDDPYECTAMLTKTEADELYKHDDVELVKLRTE